MNMRIKILSFALLLIASTTLMEARPKRKKPPISSLQIVVLIHNADKRIERGDKGLEYELDSKVYAKSGINVALAELRLNREKDSPVVALIDDRSPFEAISQFGEMAVAAGFTNIHLYVCFHATGRMAELNLGPAVKFSENPAPETAGK
jgi:hypothetical protein